MKLTLAHYIAGVTDGTLDPQTVLSHYLTKADPYNAIITRTEDYAHAQKSTGTLLGAPIGIKDNILVKGIRTTSGSKMMENFVAPYTATCYDLLEKAGGIMIAKTNMDEYAMGSTNESSFFGTVDNPAAPGYIP